MNNADLAMAIVAIITALWAVTGIAHLAIEFRRHNRNQKIAHEKMLARISKRFRDAVGELPVTWIKEMK